MRRKAWLVLTLALLTGAVAGYLALELMRERVARGALAGPDIAQVVVAARGLPAGSVLTSADVKTVAWPAGSVSDVYVRSPNDAIGRGLVSDVGADEPILSTRLAGRGSGGGLSVAIPEGMRAMSVKVDEVIGVAGFVLPGTHVDVLVTLNPTSERQNSQSLVILQDVEAIAAGQMTQRDAQGTPQDVPVVTLLVTPEQAEQLTLASTEGKIQLALRNIMDREIVETPGARPATLLRATQPAPATPRPTVRRSTPRASTSHSVVTYDGADRTVSEF